MKAIKKFIKNITYGILTKIIISIVTMAFLSLVTFSHYIQQNQIRKLQNSFGSQRKDLVVNLWNRLGMNQFPGIGQCSSSWFLTG
jgi:hypothetical protein